MSQLAKDKSQKDTIYIDAEDEITSIIDKVEASPKQIVALVLPKRTNALQSTVNMRLLKRSADQAKKKLVLITSEPGLLPLAGAVGLHTAKTLQSKPSIPPAPAQKEAIAVVSSDDVPAVKDSGEVDPTKSVGELNGEDPDSIELDNSDGKTDKKAEKATTKKDKKLKIPDFDRFRLLILAGVFGAIALVVLLMYMFIFAPEAKIVIKADSTPVSATVSATTSDKVTTVDVANSVVPSELKELKQSASETVPATGQKDLGTKATGTVKFINCSKNDKLSDTSRTLSAGTGVSSGGLTYITQTSVTVEPSSFIGDTCQENKPSVSVNVVAQSPGEQFNVGAKTYAVAGMPTMSADGSAMSGGTTKIGKVVSNQDVDNAKQKIGPKLSAESEKFQKDLEEQGYVILDETATTSEPKVTANPGVDQEATQTTVTQEQTFSVLVVKKSDLEKLLAEELNKQIDPKTQKVEGENLLDGALIRVTNKKSPTEVTISVQKTGNAIPIFDETALKEEFKGKKRGDIESNLEKRPGVKDVTVTYSPFWVSTTPKASKKITIVIEPVSTDGTN